MQKRQNFADYFDSHIRRHYGKRLGDVMHDITALEDALVHFFDNWQVTSRDGDVQRPKMRTLDAAKSNIKLWILAKTHHVIDISNLAQFPKFNRHMKKVYRTSEHVRGVEEHHPIIAEAALRQIFSFIGHITDLILSRGTPAYKDLLEHIPSGHHERYHHLFQQVIFFMLKLFLIDNDKLKIEQFEKKYDNELELNYYEFMPDKKPQNARFDSAIIPFLENKYGCNPGLAFETYLSLLSPDSDLLFQSPKKMSKRFDLSNPDIQVFYDPAIPVGVNNLRRYTTLLCSALDLETYANKSVKKTGAVLLEEYTPEKRAQAIVFKKPEDPLH